MKLIKVAEKILNLDAIAWAQPGRDPDGIFIVEVHFISQAGIADDALQLRGHEANAFMTYARTFLYVVVNGNDNNEKET